MKISQRIKEFFPDIKICIYYLLAAISFCYIYFHNTFHNVTFYEKNMGGIYYILSYTANQPNQFRLFIPYIFKAIKIIFPFLGDRTIYMGMIITITLFSLIFFYNLLNIYFKNKKINGYLTFILLFPMTWQYLILTDMFEFTDFANILFILAGYYFIVKQNDTALLITYVLGTFNHDSIGFLIPMYLLFHYKELFTKRVILNTVFMTAVIIAVRLLMLEIFKNNPDLSWRPNYIYNIYSFVTLPSHRVLRNLVLFFGGMHFFVFYFFISGRWKRFRTKYLYISFTLIPYVIIVFLIHTTLEARNYITAIPFIIIPFLLYFSTERSTFLEPKDEILSQK